MGETPRTIGRYVIDQVLGRGAMGVVYKAHDPEIDRPVAIKLVRADLLEGPDGETYLARFRQEVKAAGRCLHPNIVTIYDFGVHADGPFFAMEYVEGQALDALPRGLGLGPQAAGEIVLQLLSALACAHGLGVVHRDVKPANLLLTAGRVLKVMDFGISGIATSHLTQAGAVMGTPSYMSPEQFRGEPVDERSDLFSTGVVLHELLTGRTPFPGRSYEEVMVKLLYPEGPDLPGDDPQLPEPLRAVVARALARPREARFPSAEAMAETLRQALASVSQAPHPSAATIIAPARPEPVRPAGSLAGVGQAEVLATIERRLAHHIGPIAGRLLRQAQRDAVSVDELCERLAGAIEAAPERARFLEEVRTALRRQDAPATLAGSAGAGAPAAAVLSEAELTGLQGELTRYLGPIAGHLVRRLAATATSADDLRAKLAEHLDRPEDRRGFLRGR
ncbi:MAG: hypothetical protein JWQ97_1941 [Phenylobacterium sp.]|nr:hypothetical protein [Phenylobacterium sp.]